MLSTLAHSVLRGEHALPALLERLRETFGMRSVTLLTRTSTRRGWDIAATAGPDPCRTPAEGDTEVPIGDDIVLALRGRTLAAEDRRLVGAFAALAAVALDQRRLAKAAAEAAPLAEADRTRTALLAAVSHDLRTPIASAKAAVTGLRSHGIHWGDAERDELLATAEESLDQLTRLVENLLDMSRLQSGALAVFPRPVTLDEVVPRALGGLGPDAAGVDVHDMDAVPPVVTDPALLERVVANLVANALRYSPARVAVTASALGDRVELRIIDHGPGLPEADRERVFQPFQRLGDRSGGSGVGLGLALSRGLVEALHGTVVPEDTPGGGLTMIVDLPAAGRVVG
jgi:two-component system sensor histidine kinase KdpD